MNGIFRLNGVTIGGRGVRNHRKPVDIVETPGRTIFNVSNVRSLNKQKSKGFIEMRFDAFEGLLKLPINHIASDITVDWGDGTTDTYTSEYFMDIMNYTDNSGDPYFTGPDDSKITSWYQWHLHSPEVKHTYMTSAPRTVRITGDVVDFGGTTHSYGWRHHHVHPELSVKHNKVVFITNQTDPNNNGYLLDYSYEKTNYINFRTHMNYVKISGMSKLRNTSFAFTNCTNLKHVDFNDWDSSSLAATYYMFTNCKPEVFNAEFMIWNADAVDKIPRYDEYQYNLVYGDDYRQTCFGGVRLDAGAIINQRKLKTIGSNRPLVVSQSYGYNSVTTQLDYSEWDLRGATFFAVSYLPEQLNINIPAQPSLRPGFEILFHHLPKVESFDFTGWDVGNIENVDINRANFSEFPRGPWHLASNLKSLRFVTTNSGVEPDGLDNMADMNYTSMEEVHIFVYGNDITSLDFDNITGDPSKLKQLQLFIPSSNFGNLDLTGLTCTDPHARDLRIRLNNCAMTDLYVGENLRVVAMDLQRCERVTTIHGKMWIAPYTNPDDIYIHEPYDQQEYGFAGTPLLTNVDMSKVDLTGRYNLSNYFSGSSMLETAHSFQMNPDMSRIMFLGSCFTTATLSTDALDWVNSWRNVSIDNAEYRTTKPVEFDMYYSANQETKGMFAAASIPGTLDLRAWDVDFASESAHPRTTNPAKNNMFEGATINGDLDISTWDFKKTENLRSFFAQAEITGQVKMSANITLESVNTIRDFANGFVGDLTIDGANVDVSLITDTIFAFFDFRGKLKIINSHNWNFASLENASYMFKSTGYWGSTSVPMEVDMDSWTFGINGVPISHIFDGNAGGTTLQQVSGWDIRPSVCTGAFAQTDIEDIDLASWNMSAVDDYTLNGETAASTSGSFYRLFDNCDQLKTVNIPWGQASQEWSIASCRRMFSGCSNLTTITGMDDWNMSSVGDFTAPSYQQPPAPTGNRVNLSNEYQRFEHMFNQCTSLNTLDFSGWCVEGVEAPVFRLGSGYTVTGHDGTILHGAFPPTYSTSIANYDFIMSLKQNGDGLYLHVVHTLIPSNTILSNTVLKMIEWSIPVPASNEDYTGWGTVNTIGGEDYLTPHTQFNQGFINSIEMTAELTPASSVGNTTTWRIDPKYVLVDQQKGGYMYYAEDADIDGKIKLTPGWDNELSESEFNINNIRNKLSSQSNFATSWKGMRSTKFGVTLSLRDNSNVELLSKTKNNITYDATYSGLALYDPNATFDIDVSGATYGILGDKFYNYKQVVNPLPSWNVACNP